MLEKLNSRSALIDGDVRPIDDAPELVPDIASSSDGDWYERAMAEEDHERALDALQEIGEKAGPSVDLGVRALALLEALDEYAIANKLEGYLRSGKPIQDARSVENCRREHLQAGSSALREAFGHDQMVEAGFSPYDVGDDFIATRILFKKIFLDPKDKQSAKRRTKYKKRLSKQQNLGGVNKKSPS
jgi:hypothetical protein